MPDRTIERTAAEWRAWLTERVADLLQVPVSEVRPDVLLAEYGLDSVYALTLAGEIEDEIARVIDPTVIWDRPTIDELAAFLVAGPAQQEPAR